MIAVRINPPPSHSAIELGKNKEIKMRTSEREKGEKLILEIGRELRGEKNKNRGRGDMACLFCAST